VNCRKVSHLLSAYMDGELPGVEHRLIHGHLGQCSECRTEYQMLLQVKRLLAGMRIREPRAEFPQEVLHRLTAEQSAAQGSLDSWLRHFTQWWRQIAPPPPIIAFGAGLAVVGMLWTIRMIDSSDGLAWSTANTAAQSPLRTSSIATDGDMIGVSLDSSWTRLPSSVPVGSSDWNRSLPAGAMPVTFLHNQAAPFRSEPGALAGPSYFHP
jgi:hypothetical protein